MDIMDMEGIGTGIRMNSTKMMETRRILISPFTSKMVSSLKWMK